MTAPHPPSFTTVALVAAGLVLCLVSLCFAFLALLPHVEADLPQAQRIAKRVYSTSAALSLVLGCFASVPYITSFLSLLLSASLALSLKAISPSTSSSRSSLLLLIFSHLLLPLLTHHSLLSHLSRHTFRSHAVQTAPRLPGGRVSWDIPDGDVASVAAGVVRSPSLIETVVLFVVLIWGQTMCAWVLWLGIEGKRHTWVLPTVSVGQILGQGERRDKQM